MHRMTSVNDFDLDRLSVLDRFQGYQDERNRLQINHRLLKLKE